MSAHVYILPVLSIVALVSCVNALILLLRTELQKAPSSLYLVAFFYNEVILHVLLLTMSGENQLRTDTAGAQGWCRVYAYLSDCTDFLACWIAMVIAVKALIGVRFPSSGLNGRRTAYCVLALILLGALLLSSRIIATHGDTQFSRFRCILRLQADDSFALTWNLYFWLQFLFPSVTTATLVGYTSWLIRNFNAPAPNVFNAEIIRRHEETKAETVMLMVVCGTFMFFTIPAIGLYILRDHGREWVWHYEKTLTTWEQYWLHLRATAMFVSLQVGPALRRSMKRLCCGKKRRKRTTTPRLATHQEEPADGPSVATNPMV